MIQNLAFFGATGGCAGSCLAAALKQGYTCTALARTPSKLTAFMHEKDVDSFTLDSHLQIIPGDIRDLEAVKQTLAHADIIVSGIGAYPKFQWSPRKPLALIDPAICADGISTILQACQELQKPNAKRKKPMLISISTAGVQTPGKPRALPLLYLTFYYWLLAEPHADKVALEAKIHEYMQLQGNQKGIEGYILVRPSILLDGEKKGVGDVRAGLPEDPPVGYSIDRRVDGEWIFEKLVRGGGADGVWRNGEVIVTY
ncbi:hypothetical protein M409DRAFT_24647 [Zasmidium cellare ATCC 36951]|uniref:NAD(P)-binding domain-containing protein n=1 Tax=Zasmidium cellare ATCC 36951 TaxID=1080233 RepID=A0A6A6CDJ7_ZASCE|nr:uncharacterized protein M409DRAFT_24647 [Zasmidium cellare ATCC 36951]KAF2165264.1 hypothetical protein M409DRAFT_24647 [Zasmidium cellare ATCC 36951]